MKDLFWFIADMLEEPLKMALFAIIVIASAGIFGGLVYLITLGATIFFYIVAGVVAFIFLILWYAIMSVTLELLG